MKGQIAFEFVMYSVLVLIMVISILGIISGLYADKNEEKSRVQIITYGRGLQKELIVASEVRAGYKREINVPMTVYGNEYSINNTEYNFQLLFKDSVYEFATPRLFGNFVLGKNTIRNNGTVVILNG